ncbi:unnamed protein product [Allacma fusca]|uniref:Major facilitator superfamily (MFS) profile domain-containing protein n=1 Tax=Allacma fusca TaxID=39272 RepID=A0A8J2K352_9HEXA|nr:unnamed protein product [Allacma fusca]
MAPFYPAEAEAKGATASQYGMVFGIFELVAFVSSPVFGKYLHVLGPRRTFIAGILITGFNLSPVQTGLVFVIYGGIYALTAPAWGWLCDQLLGSFVITLFGEVTIFLGFLIIGPAAFLPTETVLWLTCLGLVVYGVGLGATMVASFIMALEEAVGHGFSDNVQTYGVISALWNSFFALGSFIGPSLGGVLLDIGGFRWASVFVLGTQLIVLALFSGFMLLTRKCGVKDKYSQNLTDTTPLLRPEDPCCSKMLLSGSFNSSEFGGQHYGTNDGLSRTFSSSSS